MRKNIAYLYGVSILLLAFLSMAKPSFCQTKPTYAIVIHGGAGVMHPGVFTPEKEDAYHTSLKNALSIGKKILADEGTSMDAVEATIRFLEDDSLFNAGKGAVFTYEGSHELDASIMNGKDLACGAVAGVSHIKNPISAARAVMEKSPHVLLSGDGAEDFARLCGLDMVDPSYFYTESRYKALLKMKEDNNISEKKGTVGCVALDIHGNLAAGTSTGGMTGKKFKRVGDSPIIGAGTFADNRSCAVSCTGHGEFFIRYSVAKDVAALVEYSGLSVNEAADKVILDKLIKAGGEGGLIALDKSGNIAMSFNTPAMFRGYALPDKMETFIFK